MALTAVEDYTFKIGVLFSTFESTSYVPWSDPTMVRILETDDLSQTAILRKYDVSGDLLWAVDDIEDGDPNADYLESGRYVEFAILSITDKRTGRTLNAGQMPATPEAWATAVAAGEALENETGQVSWTTPGLENRLRVRMTVIVKVVDVFLCGGFY